MFSIKEALDLLKEPSDDEECNDYEEAKDDRMMKLSKKEETMMSEIKSKMKYAGESYHNVASPQIEISKFAFNVIKMDVNRYA